MPKAKLDAPAFLTNRKVAPLSHLAFRVYVCSIVWAVGNETDGFIPPTPGRGGAAHPLPATIGISRRQFDRAVSELVESGLWEGTDGGWLVHDFLDYNPSRDRAAREREQGAERQRRVRMSRRESRPLSRGVSRRDNHKEEKPLEQTQTANPEQKTVAPRQRRDLAWEAFMQATATEPTELSAAQRAVLNGQLRGLRNLPQMRNLSDEQQSEEIIRRAGNHFTIPTPDQLVRLWASLGTPRAVTRQAPKDNARRLAERAVGGKP